MQYWNKGVFVSVIFQYVLILSSCWHTGCNEGYLCGTGHPDALKRPPVRGENNLSCLYPEDYVTRLPNWTFEHSTNWDEKYNLTSPEIIEKRNKYFVEGEKKARLFDGNCAASHCGVLPDYNDTFLMDYSLYICVASSPEFIYSIKLLIPSLLFTLLTIFE